MAKSPHEDLFDALYSVFAGLGSTPFGSGDVFARVFQRATDRERAEVGKLPAVLVEITARDDNALGRDHVQAEARLRLRTARDRDIAEENAVAEGIRAAFDGAQLSGTDWTWSDAYVIPAQRMAGTEHYRECEIGLRTLGTRGTAAGRLLWARSASLSFVPGAGGSSIDVDGVEAFSGEAGVDLVPFRRRGERFDAYTAVGGGASMTFVVKVRDDVPSAPTIPVGVAGTLSVYKNGRDTSVGVLAGAFVFSDRTHLGRVGGAQTYRLTGRFTGAYSEKA